LASFKELGVSNVFVKALKEMNIENPTDIQMKAIPFLLTKRKDFVGQAQTGTGKTAAFCLPLLHNLDIKDNKPQALILVPTRELGMQITKQIFKFTKYSAKIFCEGVFGGMPIDKQMKALRRDTHIIVATPGRLRDLMKRSAVNLTQVKTVILDEADEMLKMGFKEDIDVILENSTTRTATWLFSATMPKGIQSIIKRFMAPTAYKIELAESKTVNRNIDHQYLVCNAQEKFLFLLHFLNTQGKYNRGIIFCKKKTDAQALSLQLLAKKIPVDSIHGDLLQKERDKVMRAFKNQKLRILVATDVAARGIDIENLAYVVHYNLPDQLEYYTHRSGRTARAGNKGLSLAFIESKELKNLRFIENKLKIKMKRIRV